MQITTILLTLLFISISINAQSNTEEASVSFGSSCELNSAHFDSLANLMKGNDERLFVVARLGKGEISRNFNRRRLHNVRTYFKDWKSVPNWNISAKRFVFAEGESLKTEEGRIEFYLGSKLLLVSLVKRYRDICVSCCELDARYYGVGKFDKPKRKKNR
jgi:hypothetical protein